MLPYLCILCGARCAGRDLCAGCRDDFPWIRGACRRCAAPLALPSSVAECGRCLRRPPPQAETRAPLGYAFPVDQLLLKLKFGNSLPPGRVLGEVLAEYLLGDAVPMQASHGQRAAPTEFRPPDVLVPVPLHPKRLRERGYNQALELARPVARALRVPVLHACRRTRHTPPQSTLTGADRRRNLQHAFVADASLAGLHVAVVDDVYTTGSTIAALTRTLLDAGAASVVAWCVARA